MPFSAPAFSVSLPPTSLGMASNNATELVPPQVRESVFHSAVFLPSFHSMTLRRLLASALKPSSLLSCTATACFGLANAAPHSRSSNLVRILVTHTDPIWDDMASHLPHSGSHPRCIIVHAPRTVRSSGLHELRSGTIHHTNTTCRREGS